MSAEWKVGLSFGALVAWDGEHWRWLEAGPVCFYQPPPDMRPLVLIDPEVEEQVDRLLSLYHAGVTRASDVREMQAALREYASPTPPKPDEPMGLGAVVVDADGKEWVRVYRASRPWLESDSVEWRNYADISAVEVLSAGVES